MLVARQSVLLCTFKFVCGIKLLIGTSCSPLILFLLSCFMKGYWIHVDGALGATYMPFIHMAFNQGRTTIKPPPVFDFWLPFVCSICASGHKFPEAPWPLGIFMTKTGLQLLPPTTLEYIGSPDTTFAGSRNGLSSLIWWTHISDHNYESQVEKVLTCLNLVKYAYNELQKVQTDTGKDI